VDLINVSKNNNNNIDIDDDDEDIQVAVRMCNLRKSDIATLLKTNIHFSCGLLLNENIFENKNYYHSASDFAHSSSVCVCVSCGIIDSFIFIFKKQNI
jgi:hypothetical protein